MKHHVYVMQMSEICNTMQPAISYIGIPPAITQFGAPHARPSPRLYAPQCHALTFASICCCLRLSYSLPNTSLYPYAARPEAAEETL